MSDVIFDQGVDSMSTSVTQTPAWQNLLAHRAAIQTTQIRDLFAQDPERFSKFHVTFKDIFLFFKNMFITT